MSGIIDSLYHIKYNPFNSSELIISFYSTLNHVENNLILAPLVIPLCSHSIFRDKLNNAVFGEKKKSTLWSVFDDVSKLHDLQERLNQFKTITEQSIQYCLVNDWLIIDTKNLDLKIESNIDRSLISNKNSINLAKLLSNHSVTEIYSYFRVTP